ncbi:MAG: hypothetical protein ACXVX0_16615, partial [Blastococcus sp.]
DGDLGRSRAVVEAFLSAARGGDLAGLLGLLAPGVVLRADATTVRAGAATEAFGADALAGTFSGRARAAVLALVDGRPGAVWAMGGRPRVVFRFTLGGGLITGIEMIGDADAVGAFALELLEAPPA